jgi:hypothetical protein
VMVVLMGIRGSAGVGVARWAEKDLTSMKKKLTHLGGNGTAGTGGVEVDRDVEALAMDGMAGGMLPDGKAGARGGGTKDRAGGTETND